MKRSRNERKKPGAPAWMVTYSDIVTLLLTFFVMLLARMDLSDVDLVNLKKVIHKIRAGFPRTLSRTVSPTKPLLSKTINQWYSEGAGPGGGENRVHLGDETRLKPVDDGVEISFGGQTLFETGSWAVSDLGKDIIRSLVPELQSTYTPIDIRGHTSADPQDAIVIRGDPDDEHALLIEPYNPDNPEHVGRQEHTVLGWLRADEVSRTLIGSSYRDFDVDPSRLRVGSQGKYDQIQSGLDPEKDHLNRRVSLMISEQPE